MLSFMYRESLVSPINKRPASSPPRRHFHQMTLSPGCRASCLAASSSIRATFPRQVTHVHVRLNSFRGLPQVCITRDHLTTIAVCSKLFSLPAIPRRPIPGLLRGLAAGERDAVLCRYLVIIGTPGPVLPSLCPFTGNSSPCDSPLAAPPLPWER